MLTRIVPSPIGGHHDLKLEPPPRAGLGQRIDRACTWLWKRALRGAVAAHRRAHKRNGGRHRCQPPLRRAKDLPVFVRHFAFPKVGSHGNRSWLTSSGVASHLTAPSEEEPWPPGPVRHRKRLAAFPSSPAKVGTEVPHQSRPMFRGPSWDDLCCVPLCRPDPKTASAASRSRKIISSGASSRLTSNSIPKEALQAPAGGDRVFSHLPPGGGGDVRPDHPLLMNAAPSRAKR